MFFIICTVFVLAFSSSAESKCEDRISPTNIFTVTDTNGNFKENLTSCARLVDCYPGLCETQGKNNGACCLACKAAFGTTKCINKASKCVPVFVFPGGLQENKKEITSCDIIVEQYNQFCDKNSFGGSGNACCKACKEGPKTGPTPAPPSPTPGPISDPTPAPTPGPISDPTPAPTPSPPSGPTPPPSGGCEDKLSESSSINVLDSNKKFVERVTSCKRLATCHRSLCEGSSGKPGGSCCKSCKQLVGDLNCMNKASPCLPVYVIPGGNPKKKKPIHDCRMIVKSYFLFCDENDASSFGGPGKSCCRACKEAPNPKKDAACVDSTTWMLGKGKKAKTCEQLAKSSKKMKKCCTKNKKGKGTSMGCQAACCASCAQFM